MRYAGYVRVSDEEQVEGYSLDAQARAIRDWVARQDGELAGSLTVLYCDEGHSARTDERPAFQEMIAAARAGRFEAIVVHKFDRLARNREDAVTYKALLRRQLGLKVFSVTEPSEDSDGLVGMLVEGMLEVVAQWYSLNLAAETRKGKMEKAREGLWPGAAPTGYCQGRCRNCRDPNGPGYCPHAGQPDRGDGRVLMPHPITGQAVRLAFEWYSTGEFSDRDVAGRLNEHVVETSDGRTVHFYTRFYGRRNGPDGPRPFDKDTVKAILTRPFYAGLIEYYGRDPATGRRRKKPIIVTQGRHEPLISLDLFARCQDIRRSRGRASQSQSLGRVTRVYPLAGILVCEECGERMRAQAMHQGIRYYRCKSRIQRRNACTQPTVRAEKMEEEVERVVGRLTLPAEVIDRVLAYLVSGEDVEALARQKKMAEAAFERAQELYLAGDIGRDRYERARREYRQQIAALSPGTQPEATTARAWLADFARLWAAASPLERKGLLRTMFQEVVVRGQQVVGYRANPPFDRLLGVDGPPGGPAAGQ